MTRFRRMLMAMPVAGHITSSYGMRMHPLLGYTRMHKGMDIGAPYGSPIYAATDGTVIMAGRAGGYGNFVKLNHAKRRGMHIRRHASLGEHANAETRADHVAYAFETCHLDTHAKPFADALSRGATQLRNRHPVRHADDVVERSSDRARQSCLPRSCR